MFLVLVSSRSNSLLLMFFGLLPSKEILVENTKPCSLGNFLNKVDESLCTSPTPPPFHLCSFCCSHQMGPFVSAL